MSIKKIGIYLPFHPNQEVETQGIERLLIFLLHGLLANPNIQLVIATGKNSQSVLIKLLAEHHIDTDHLEFITAKSTTLLDLISKSTARQSSTTQQIIQQINHPMPKKSCLASIHCIKLIIPKPIKSLIKAVMQYLKTLAPINTKQLIKQINQRSDIPVWYCPTCFWPEVTNIKKRVIVALSDCRHIDLRHNAQHILNMADHIICYSEYVKNKYIAQHSNIPDNKISVIKHGSVTPPPVSIDGLTNYFSTHFLPGSYLHNFDFSDVPFILYASQIQPSQNMVNLVKAFKIALREKYKNIKLVLTCNPKHHPAVYQFIEQHQLLFDVVFLFDIPAEVLIALNKLALFSINPSLFEGGFPFTFTEAYSVGTPSILANIPPTIDLINDPELANTMLFNPFDIQKIANKIAWATDNAQLLYHLQKPLDEKLANRNWQIVAQDYLQVFEATTQQHQSTTQADILSKI